MIIACAISEAEEDDKIAIEIGELRPILLLA